MAQIIRHRRGSLEALSAVTASLQKGEIVIASGSSNLTVNNGSSIVFVAPEAGQVQAVNRFLMGTNAPNNFAAGTYNGLLKGVPYYASGSATLYLLGEGTNDIPNLVGNIQPFSTSVDSRLDSLEANIGGGAGGTLGDRVIALEAFTGSQETKNATLATYTASVNSRLDQLSNDTGSQASRLSQLETKTGSLDSDNSAQNARIDQLASYTASNDTTNTAQNARLTSLESDTGSQNTRISTLESKATTLETVTSSLLIETSNLEGFSASALIRLTNIESATSSINSTNTTQNSRLDQLSTFSGSQESKNSTLENVTSSLLIETANLETFSASALTRLTNIESATASINSTNTAQNNRLTTLESVTGSYAKLDGGNVFTGTQVITGSLFVSANLVVQGSSSLQNITASAVDIGTNTIILNTDTPAVRFAGINVVDSGSSGATGSLFWDSLNNHWLYVHPSGAGEGYNSAILIAGPKNTGALGNEIGLTEGYLPVASGEDHIKDSIIRQSLVADIITVGGELKVTGSISGSTIEGLGNATAFSTSVDSRLDAVEASLGGGGSVGTRVTALEAFTGSQESKNTTLATYTASVDSRLSQLESDSGSQDSRLDTLETKATTLESVTSSLLIETANLETFSASTLTRLTAIESATASLNSFTSSINTTIKSKLDADGVISSSAQLTNTFVQVSQTSSMAVLAAATVTVAASNTTNDSTLYPTFTNNIANGTTQLKSHPSGTFYYDGVARKVYAEAFVGGIEATNGIVSGSSQITLQDTTGFSSFNTALSNATASLLIETANLEAFSASALLRLTSLESDTGSQNTRITTLENKATTLQTYTASVDSRLNQLSTASGSAIGRLNNLESFTSSTFPTFSSSVDGRLDVLEGTGTIQGLGQGDTVTFAAINSVGNLTVGGDLTVEGNTVTLHTTQLVIEDKLITVASGSTNTSMANGAGIEVAGANATLTYASSPNAWTANIPFSASAFTGSFNVPGGSSTKRIAFRNTNDNISFVSAPTTDGDLVQWNGSDFVMSNVIDGGSF